MINDQDEKLGFVKNERNIFERGRIREEGKMRGRVVGCGVVS